MSETELIASLKTGDRAACAELLRLNGSIVFNTTLGLLQNKEDAEDVTQDIFVKVFQSIHNFKGEARLTTWIYRIAVTTALEHLRKQKTKKRFGFFQQLFSGESSIPISDIPDFNHPGVRLENKERSKELFAAIDRLPENQKTAFVLSKLEDLSNTEIAEIMQLSVSAVESLLFRARQNLKKLLSDYYINNEL